MYLKFQRRAVSQFLDFKWTQRLKFFNFTHFCLKNDLSKMLLCGPLLFGRHVKILLTPAPTPSRASSISLLKSIYGYHTLIYHSHFLKKHGTDPINPLMKIRFQVISNIQLILIPVDHITIGISFLFLRDL